MDQALQLLRIIDLRTVEGHHHIVLHHPGMASRAILVNVGDDGACRLLQLQGRSPLRGDGSDLDPEIRAGMRFWPWLGRRLAPSPEA